MTGLTKTTAKAGKTKAAAAPKTDGANEAQAKAPEAKSAHQFESADDLAHFIHHNPQFGTLPLDEQDALRKDLIDLKREQAQA